MTFEEAFREINGREPTTDEVKHALALRRVINDSDLDPVLLVFLADAKAQTSRDQGLAEVRKATTAAVERLRATLPSIANAEKSIGALQGVQTAMHDLTGLIRQTLRFGALIGAIVGVLWASSTIFLCWVSYTWGRNTVQQATHEIVCDDLNANIAAMSARWRKLGYPEAAEKLGESYDRSCR